jgi:hypothetical protein
MHALPENRQNLVEVLVDDSNTRRTLQARQTC